MKGRQAGEVVQVFYSGNTNDVVHITYEVVAQNGPQPSRPKRLRTGGVPLSSLTFDSLIIPGDFAAQFRNCLNSSPLPSLLFDLTPEITAGGRDKQSEDQRSPQAELMATGCNAPEQLKEEAPVGVEPTVADLQSAALASWRRRLGER